MSLIKVNHVFGEIGSLKNSLNYLNEHSYIYASSRHLICFNIDYEFQKHISYVNAIEYLIMSPNKDYLSIVYQNEKKSRIVIFDLNYFKNISNEKKRFFALKQSNSSNHILSICFSTNSKYLIAL